MTFKLERAPQTDEELWWVIYAMFGVALPRKRVCPDHVSPFDAVSHAFFGREPNFAVWYASRGSGKSLALAVLGLTKAFVSDVDVTILGGSMTQSLNVREHMRKLMQHKNAPLYAVDKDQATLIQMATGKAIKPLPASQTTVRGPHPPLQLLDEVDEMELRHLQRLPRAGDGAEERARRDDRGVHRRQLDLAEPGGHLHQGHRDRPRARPAGLHLVLA